MVHPGHWWKFLKFSFLFLIGDKTIRQKWGSKKSFLSFSEHQGTMTLRKGGEYQNLWKKVKITVPYNTCHCVYAQVALVEYQSRAHFCSMATSQVSNIFIHKYVGVIVFTFLHVHLYFESVENPIIKVNFHAVRITAHSLKRFC